MWSRKELKNKTKQNLEKLFFFSYLRVPNVMKRDHQSNLFLKFVPSTSLQVNQFLFIYFSVVHLQISIVLPLTTASISVQHLTFLLICLFVCYNLGLKLFSGWTIAPQWLEADREIRKIFIPYILVWLIFSRYRRSAYFTVRWYIAVWWCNLKR